jgi:hypothetical protein
VNRFTTTLTRDAHWHVWSVYDSSGRLRRRGWSPSLKDAAREAARDVRELTRLERTQIDTEQMEAW